MPNQKETLHLGNVLKNHAQDMTGKVIAVTGTTSGTGFVLAKEAAKKGGTVLLLNRASERSVNSLSQLQKMVPEGKFETIECDLQSFDSVKSAAANIKEKYNKLDVLVNNAGVMALKDTATADGYDVQMQTNVISHFLLTKELFPILKNSLQARIVNHTSMARLGGPLEMKYFLKNGGDLGGNGSDEENQKFQGPRWKRYHQTKLANCAFTYGLKKQLEEKNITNVLPLLAHPGLAATNLQITTNADGGMDVSSDFMNMAQTPEDGASGIIRAAMDKDAKSGDFYGPAGEGWFGFPDLLEPEELLLDESNLQINWEGCEKAVGTFEI